MTAIDMKMPTPSHENTCMNQSKENIYNLILKTHPLIEAIEQ